MERDELDTAVTALFIVWGRLTRSEVWAGNQHVGEAHFWRVQRQKMSGPASVRMKELVTLKCPKNKRKRRRHIFRHIFFNTHSER